MKERHQPRSLQALSLRASDRYTELRRCRLSCRRPASDVRTSRRRLCSRIRLVGVRYPPCLLVDVDDLLGRRGVERAHFLAKWRRDRARVVSAGGLADALLLVECARTVHAVADDRLSLGLYVRDDGCDLGDHNIGESGTLAADLGSNGRVNGVQVGKEALRDALRFYRSVIRWSAREQIVTGKAERTVELDGTLEDVIRERVPLSEVLCGNCGRAKPVSSSISESN